MLGTGLLCYWATHAARARYVRDMDRHHFLVTSWIATVMVSIVAVAFTMKTTYEFVSTPGLHRGLTCHNLVFALEMHPVFGWAFPLVSLLRGKLAIAGVRYVVNVTAFLIWIHAHTYVSDDTCSAVMSTLDHITSDCQAHSDNHQSLMDAVKILLSVSVVIQLANIQTIAFDEEVAEDYIFADTPFHQLPHFADHKLLRLLMIDPLFGFILAVPSFLNNHIWLGSIRIFCNIVGALLVFLAYELLQPMYEAWWCYGSSHSIEDEQIDGKHWTCHEAYMHNVDLAGHSNIESWDCINDGSYNRSAGQCIIVGMIMFAISLVEWLYMYIRAGHAGLDYAVLIICSIEDKQITKDKGMQIIRTVCPDMMQYATEPENPLHKRSMWWIRVAYTVGACGAVIYCAV